MYGTWLQGDERGWRRYRGGFEKPQPLLANWRRERLLYPVQLLTPEHRVVVAQEIQKHCIHRGWRAWAINPRTNHVHVVITATGFNGARVRDQLKANCTRSLRDTDQTFLDKPVWSRGGDWKSVNSEDDLASVVLYASDAQDAKSAESLS